MHFCSPTTAELCFTGLQEAELRSYAPFFNYAIQHFETVYKATESIPRVKYSRTPGNRPQPNENLDNAWYWKCSIKGAEKGKLLGKKLSIKDNIFVSGIPLMNGSRILEGFVPDRDATVVTRILDEGGEIVGKSTCEDLCLSGSGHSNPYGPVVNPCNRNYSAGGSSSGSAALVAEGCVDMALGTDQGGSIRNPASCCGLVGLKPTFGLVPYTDICAMDGAMAVDHVGPITSNVHDCALLLEVIAGPDFGADARQPSIGFHVPKYTEKINLPCNQLRLGVITESFEFCSQEVVKITRRIIEVIKSSNAFVNVDNISLPHHIEAAHVGSCLNIAAINTLVHHAGYINFGGQLDSRLTAAMARGFRTEAQSLSHDVKLGTMFDAYIRQKHGPAIYAKAQNLRIKHRKLYNVALEKYDVLVTPTMSSTAPPLSHDQTTLADEVSRNINTLQNRIPFNMSHHPALTLNVGLCSLTGLPIGLQIIGKHWCDDIVLQVAYAIERICKQTNLNK